MSNRSRASEELWSWARDLADDEGVEEASQQVAALTAELIVALVRRAAYHREAGATV